MNRNHASLLLLPTLFLAGCADTPPPTSTSSTAATRKPAVDESSKPPFVGMTKQQALARYGEPRKQTVTDKGEQWTYVLNFGEAVGRALIPFNFKPTDIRVGVLTFGPDAKVKEFRWDAETNG